MLNSRIQTTDDRLSIIFNALADPTRRAILEMLSKKEATVNQIAAPFSLKLATVSKHLKVLEEAGLISQGRRAQWRPRKLEPEALKQVSEWTKHYEWLWVEGLGKLDTLLQEIQSNDNANVRVQRSETSIVFSRIFDAPQALVFDMFTSPEYLKQWWAPNTCPVADCTLNFMPGGEWLYTLQYPTGKSIKVRAIYHEIDRPNKIVYSDAFIDSEGRSTNELPQGVTTLNFEKLGDKTRLTATVVYGSELDVEKAIARGMAEGINETWAKLADLVESSNG